MQEDWTCCLGEVKYGDKHGGRHGSTTKAK